jgi:hypothetical protein
LHRNRGTASIAKWEKFDVIPTIDAERMVHIEVGGWMS